MSNVRLIINYDNRKFSNDSYGVKVTVDPLSVPVSMQKCLIVRRGSDIIRENLVRMATYSEVYTSPLPELPSTVNRFTSVSLGSIPVSTILTVYSPLWWMQYFGSASTITVTTIDGNGLLSAPLPAFSNTLHFIAGGVHFYDGVANRSYSGTGNYYRTAAHSSEWETYDAASNVYSVLLSTAQPLVDEYNSDTFSLQTQKIYS